MFRNTQLLPSEMKTTVNQKLIETGEKDRLRELLHTRLVECGWRDQVKMHCKEVVKQHGVENITVDELVGEVTAKSRALVPDSVKKELLQKIKLFLMQQADVKV